jgi:gas vesicle protein
MKRVVVALLVAGSLAAVAACSSGGKSASQQVCDDKSAFSSSVQQVGNDIRALNLGQARDSASKAVDAFNQLVDSVRKLSDEKRQSVSPHLDNIQSDVSAFTDVNNVSELSSALDRTRSDAQSAVDAIQSDLNCG